MTILCSDCQAMQQPDTDYQCWMVDVCGEEGCCSDAADSQAEMDEMAGRRKRFWAAYDRYMAGERKTQPYPSQFGLAYNQEVGPTY